MSTFSVICTDSVKNTVRRVTAIGHGVLLSDRACGQIDTSIVSSGGDAPVITGPGHTVEVGRVKLLAPMKAIINMPMAALLSGEVHVKVRCAMSMMIFDPVRRHVVNNAQITSNSLLETRMDAAPNEASKLSARVVTAQSTIAVDV